jgi:DNA-binding transcriptional MocR family regulator
MPVSREHKKGPNVFPSISADAALSFLKDTKGALTWTARDLADTLKIDRREAEQALGFLQAQGYVQPRGTKGQWITTPAGETVSGAKPPRFTPESVQEALTALKHRFRDNNKNRQAPFRITDAVAFGDFLLPDRARVQSADVGIRLARREDSLRKNTSAVQPRSASDAKAERNFQRELRAKSTHVTLRPYADWMRRRSHIELL